MVGEQSIILTAQTIEPILRFQSGLWAGEVKRGHNKALTLT